MRYLIILITVIFSVGCKEQRGPKEEIAGMEAEMRMHQDIDTSLANNITGLYLSYAGSNPEDTISPYYIVRSADILKELDGKALKSVNTYGLILENYPDHKLAPRATFMIGFVFDDKLHDMERAARSYRYFLERYPSHPLASQAQNLLNIIESDLTEEELVAKWLEQSKADTNQSQTE